MVALGTIIVVPVFTKRASHWRAVGSENLSLWPYNRSNRYVTNIPRELMSPSRFTLDLYMIPQRITPLEDTSASMIISSTTVMGIVKDSYSFPHYRFAVADRYWLRLLRSSLLCGF